jgi:hypothetical protein
LPALDDMQPSQGSLLLFITVPHFSLIVNDSDSTW